MNVRVAERYTLHVERSIWLKARAMALEWHPCVTAHLNDQMITPVSDCQRRKVWVFVRIKSIIDSCFTQPRSMANQNSVSATPRRQTPEFCFRVLIIRRANAGKTSILQRICDTTESPAIYRRIYEDGKAYHEKKVSILTFL